MFLENSLNKSRRSGWIEVIAGSMFSGKTEELIRRLKRATIARQSVEIFKPLIDNRYSDEEVVSHDANAVQSVAVAHSHDILQHTQDAKVVGIDEAQFFDNELVEVCNTLADRGVRVIIAGLDMDFRRQPFGPMPALLATAEYVTKVHAICIQCGDLAHYSFRTSGPDSLVVLGEKDKYQPLCRDCYQKKTKQNATTAKSYEKKQSSVA